MDKAKKVTYLEQLGLEPVERLNKTICRKRVAFLKRQIRRQAYSGPLLKKAKYYASWYQWMADNGGTRAS